MESRLRTAFVIVLALFLAIAARLFQLQVVEGARYYRLSEQNRIRRFITPAPRGKILDRKGQVLADSRPSFSILLVPSEADSAGVQLLATIIGVTTDEIWNRLQHAESGMTPVRLRRAADLELVAQVEENSTSIPGVVVKSEPQRNYPFGSLFAHVLGYVNEISEPELTRDTSYRQGNTVGVAGLEAKYEPLLRGHDGTRYVIVNAWGREVGTLPEREEFLPVLGQELHLTLDAEVQQRAVKLLEPYRKGAIVGVNLRDGGVICLVSKPAFDPNLLSGSITAEQWNALSNDKETPFVNRTAMSIYNPGSLLKPLTAITGLRQGVINEHSTFQPCEGVFDYGRRKFRCLAKHGRLDLGPAIVNSCNIYFYQLGLRIGVESLDAGMDEFGLGSPTGIDLPTERSGIVPSRAWLDKRYGEGNWSSGIVVNLAIGQGEVQMTPLQLAVFYAAIAGSGEYYVPHLLDYRRSSDGSSVRIQPEKRRVSVPAQYFSLVREALVGVVEKGTGTAAYVPGITVAGKTGTAEHTGGEDHAWFACYAGRPSPEVAFVVLIENGGKGGAIAAPIARSLIKQYYGITEEAPAADSLAAGDKSANQDSLRESTGNGDKPPKRKTVRKSKTPARKKAR